MSFTRKIAFTLDSFIKIATLDIWWKNISYKIVKRTFNSTFFKIKRKGNSVLRFIDYSIVKYEFCPHKLANSKGCFVIRKFL